MKKITAIVCLFCLVNYTQAQKTKIVDKSVSFTTAFGSSDFSTSIAYQHLLKVGKKQKFGIGAGVRLTNYFASNKYYTTAPAKLTSGKSGPGVFFSETIDKNIDSVLFNKAQQNSLNISLNFDYSITKKLNVGFNIDAIGFTFGAKQKGTYYANSGATTPTDAKPTGFNLLLVSDNDLGALNSEFNAKYKFNDKWNAKVGFQFLFTEYTTTTKVQTTPDLQKNDRFRNKSSAISIGVVYNL